jgi:hypothetical protein
VTGEVHGRHRGILDKDMLLSMLHGGDAGVQGHAGVPRWGTLTSRQGHDGLPGGVHRRLRVV